MIFGFERMRPLPPAGGSVVMTASRMLVSVGIDAGITSR